MEEGKCTLYRENGNGGWEVIGFFDDFPSALCALQAEREKEDGMAMKIERDKSNEKVAVT